MITVKQLLGTASVGLILFTMYEQNKSITHFKNEISALKNTIQKQDSSLSNQYDELFSAQSELGRYQMALEILKDGEDPKAAKTFEHVLTTQTE
jgi:hypothetical protein